MISADYDRLILTINFYDWTTYIIITTFSKTLRSDILNSSCFIHCKRFSKLKCWVISYLDCMWLSDTRFYFVHHLNRNAPSSFRRKGFLALFFNIMWFWYNSVNVFVVEKVCSWEVQKSWKFFKVLAAMQVKTAVHKDVL